MYKNFFIFSFTILTIATLAAATQKTNKLVDVLTQNTQAIPTPQIPTTTPTKRMVSITSNVKPEMLIKNYWGKHTPSQFAIIVNGKPLEPGKTATVSIENNTLPIQFSYSFMKGIHKGKNEVTFEVPEKQDKLALTFSWENDYRIILDNAKPLLKKPISSCQT